MAANQPVIPYPLRTSQELNRRASGWTRDHTDPKAVPNPHDQYLLETDALQVFAFASYGALSRQTPGVGSDIGAGWQTIEFDTQRTTPRGIVTDPIVNTMTFSNRGVYAVSVTIGFEHNSSNQGRLTNIRFWNETDGGPYGLPIVIATGRNAEATAYALTTLFEVTDTEKDDVFRLEIGGGDSYTSVDWDVSEWATWNVGEWREELPSDE